LYLTREEESALKGEQGEIMQMAYRILVATGEATDAEKLIPIEWTHLAGVNYNKRNFYPVSVKMPELK